MLSHLALICTCLHINLFAGPLICGIIWSEWSFLLLNCSKLLLCSEFSLASLVWIVASHALLMDRIGNCFWGWDAMCVSIPALLFLSAVLRQPCLLLCRILVWILLLSHLWLNNLLRALRGILLLLLLLYSNWRVHLVSGTSSVCTLVFRHDIVKRLILKICIAFLFLWFVYTVHRWSTSCVGSL